MRHSIATLPGAAARAPNKQARDVRQPTRRRKGSDAAPTDQQPIPKSSFFRRPPTRDVTRGDERMNHRHTTGAISFSCPVGDGERHDARCGHSD
jgi:hypothetical protein